MYTSVPGVQAYCGSLPSHCLPNLVNLTCQIAIAEVQSYQSSPKPMARPWNLRRNLKLGESAKPESSQVMQQSCSSMTRSLQVETSSWSGRSQRANGLWSYLKLPLHLGESDTYYQWPCVDANKSGCAFIVISTFTMGNCFDDEGTLNGWTVGLKLSKIGQVDLEKKVLK